MPRPYFDDLYSDLPAEGGEHEDATANPQQSSEEPSSFEQSRSLHYIPTGSGDYHESDVVEGDPDEYIAHYLSPADGFHSSYSDDQHAYSEHRPGLPVDTTTDSTPNSPNLGFGAFHHGLDQTEVVALSGPQPTSAAVPRIPNVLVDDPSLGISSGANPKATEARSERERSGSFNTPPDPDAPASLVPQRQTPTLTPQPHWRQPSTSSSSRIVQPSDRTPFLGVPLEAPPAYTPSPTSPTNSQFPPERGQAGSNHNSPQRGYGTTMGQPENQWLLGQGGPESMASPGQGSREGEGFFYRRKKQASAQRNLIAKILLFALLVSVFAGILTGVVNAVVATQRPRKLPSGHEGKRPTDPAPIRNKPLPSEGKGRLKWEPSPQCAPGFHDFGLQHYSLNFGAGESAALVQTVEDKYPDGGPEWHLDVGGDVIVQRVSSEFSTGFSVEVLANSEKLVVASNWDPDKQSLTLTVPRVLEWHGRLRPCIQMRVTASIPEGAELQLFQVMTVHLDVTADPRLDLKAAVAALETVVGDVLVAEGAHLDGRSISIHTVSGDVRGTLPLYDTLDISTTSGDVDCKVNPQEADANRKAANLVIGTMSGDVRIREPVDKIPARDYTVDIESYSGDLDIAVAASSKLKIETHSGGIHANILPVLDHNLPKCGSPLWTVSTYSGDQKVWVRDPLWTSDSGVVMQKVHAYKEHMLDCLASSHNALSGDISIQYPSSWSGKFEAQSVTGSLDASGKDVVLDSRSHKPGSNSMKGHHYDGKSALSVTLVSGDVNILIGDK